MKHISSENTKLQNKNKRLKAEIKDADAEIENMKYGTND